MLKQIASLGTTLNRADLKSVKGGRSVEYKPLNDGGCVKIVRDNDGNVIKIKHKDRYDGMC